MSKKKICFIAQFPPPMHGLSKAVETLYNSELNASVNSDGEFEFEKVDDRFHLDENKRQHHDKIDDGVLFDDVIGDQSRVQKKHSEHHKRDAGTNQRKTARRERIGCDIGFKITDTFHHFIADQPENDL